MTIGTQQLQETGLHVTQEPRIMLVAVNSTGRAGGYHVITLKHIRMVDKALASVPPTTVTSTLATQTINQLLTPPRP
jgi:uncharacterized membrane protein